MLNKQIAKIFYEIALYLRMQDVAFKPQAFEKAAMNLEGLSEDVKDIYKEQGIEGLKKINGIGQGLAEKIIEYIETGKIKEYEDLKKKMPVNVEELTAVEGVGPKMVRDLYKHLKIKNLEDLEKAAKAGKIRELAHFGEKTEKNILQSIEFLKRSHGRFTLGEILPWVEQIKKRLKTLKEVKQISEAGSVRRRKETIGDVDVLVTASNPEKVIDFFTKSPDIVKIWGKGPTKASIRLRQGFDVDLRVLPENKFGSALQYFTGSKEHNVAVRKIAIDKGLKLSEYGLFSGSKIIAGKTEKEIYDKLGMDMPEPEIRENTGEVEAALKHQLPKLIELKDIKGDLHIQTNWNGGHNSIPEMVEYAIKLGYEYIGISDHTKFLRIEHGLDESEQAEQKKEIEKLNLKYKNKIRILQGCEANILGDGSIDIKDKALAKLDYVIAGVHSQMKMTKEQMTERIIKAIRNPNVNIISHPTGRIINRRDEYQIDFDKILETAKETNTILEINAHPARLDLNDINIRRAKKTGVKMIVNTDAHAVEEMDLMIYGVNQARRGWAERNNIVNCWSVEKFLSSLKK